MINSYKKWCTLFLLAIGSVTFVTVAVNYLVDPLWCFRHINRYNRNAIIIDQRLQKTNEITFGNNEYDAVILGSSRTELVNQNEFGNCKAFNYAIPALTPEEYLPYLNYFKSRTGDRAKCIFIGLDFFSTTKSRPIQHNRPEYYISQANEQHYRLKTLLGLDTLRLLIKAKFNKKQYFKYDRANNLLIPNAIPAEELKRIFNNRLEMFKTSFYNKDTYQYDTKIINIYSEVARTNVSNNVIVFITPESQPLYEYLIKSGRFEDYARWLTDIVQTFGGVYNFMYLNTITRNTDNYVDADHFYPRIGTLIAHKLSGIKDENIPSDFGVYVTEDNLQQHLAFLRTQAENIIRNTFKN